MKRFYDATLMLFTGAVLAGVLTGLAAVAQSPISAQGPYIGMDVKPPERYSADQQHKMLDDMHAAGVRLVRAWVVNESSYEFIRYATSLGMKIELTVPLQYRPDAAKRAAVADAPQMYPSYALSAVDPALTAANFQTQLTRLETMGVSIVAIEVGNEQNNAGFNGEFPIHDAHDPGARKNFSVDDLKNDPEGRIIANGFRQYVKVMAAVKQVRDQSKLNRRTPLLLGGLADSGDEKPWPDSRWSAVSIGASIRFMRQMGLDDYVDAYAIHTYPWKNGPGEPGPATNRRNRLEKFALSECHAGGQGKPCWVTEWGFQNPNYSCPSNETDRAALVRELMGDFRPYVQQGRIIGLMYYVWGRDAWAKAEDPYAVFRCGELTESGRLAIDARLLH